MPPLAVQSLPLGLLSGMRRLFDSVRKSPFHPRDFVSHPDEVCDFFPLHPTDFVSHPDEVCDFFPLHRTPAATIVFTHHSVQRDGRLAKVLKALTTSSGPIADEVNNLLTLLEQRDAESTYVFGASKIRQRLTEAYGFSANTLAFSGDGLASGQGRMGELFRFLRANVFVNSSMSAMAFVCTEHTTVQDLCVTAAFCHLSFRPC